MKTPFSLFHKISKILPQARETVEKVVIERLDFVGTGLVPVLTPRRTATLRAERTQCEARAVPTTTSPC